MNQLVQFFIANPFLLFLLAAWSIIWKGIALWKSARLSQKAWYVVLLILNTVGILEIIYIFAIARPREKRKV